jgi:hypothetical protein
MMRDDEIEMQGIVCVGVSQSVSQSVGKWVWMDEIIFDWIWNNDVQSFEFRVNWFVDFVHRPEF